MSEVSAQHVKDLREKTGAGFMDCKRRAPRERRRSSREPSGISASAGFAAAAKKARRTTAEGVIGSYIHAGGKIGVLVEVNCETDFVARTDDFQQFVREPRDAGRRRASRSTSVARRFPLPSSSASAQIYAAQARAVGQAAAGRRQDGRGQGRQVRRRGVPASIKTTSKEPGEARSPGRRRRDRQARRKHFRPPVHALPARRRH